MKLPFIFAHLLHTAINKVLLLDEDVPLALQKMQGKVIQLQITHPELDVFLFVHADEIEVMSGFDGEIDTTITGSAFSLTSMSKSNKGLFTGDVKISGDVELGKRFSRFIDRIDVDLEEHLSSFVGDAAAYQIGLSIRKIQQFVNKNIDNNQQNLSEYLQEEISLLASHHEINSFTESVDEVRSTFDRLQARVSLLEKQHKAS